MLSKMGRMLAGTCLALATLAMVAAASAQDLIEYALMSGLILGNLTGGSQQKSRWRLAFDQAGSQPSRRRPSESDGVSLHRHSGLRADPERPP